MRLDFFFILDSSSSIKKTNFQYVREYVIGLIATMPIGQDLTRVGILTYNNDVSIRPLNLGLRLDTAATANMSSSQLDFDKYNAAV